MRTFKKKVNLFLFYFLPFTSVLFWAYYSSVNNHNINKIEYSNNAFEGVYLSNFYDFHISSGSFDIKHQYSKFLELSTNAIARDFGGSFFTSGYSDSMRAENGGFFTKSAKLDTVISSDFFLGLNRKFRFKTVGGDKFALSEFVGRDLKLEDINGEYYYGTLLNVDGNVLEISALLPPFTAIKHLIFPKIIKDQIKPFTMMLNQDQMGVVRGGLVQVIEPKAESQGFHLRHLPFHNKINIEKNYTLLVGGKELKIDQVIRVNDKEFIVTHDSSSFIEPYFDTRKNIVKVIPSIQKNQRETVIDVDTSFDDGFFYGRNSNYDISLKSAKYLMPKKRIKLDNDDIEYFVSDVDYNRNVITVDVTKSFCLNLKHIVNMEMSVQLRDKFMQSEFESEKTCLEKIFNLSSILKEGFYKQYYDFISESKLNGESLWKRGGAEILSLGEAVLNKNEVKQGNNSGYAKDFSIWEIYPGSLLNLYYYKENPAPTEMMIHVLGKESRLEYYSSFRNSGVDYVAFAKPERFTQWLINWHWPFFRELVHKYQPILDLDEFSLWKIEKKKDAEKKRSEYLLLDGRTLISKSHDIELYTVRIDYEIEMPFGFIPLLGKSTRFLINKTGALNEMPVSIPWYESSFEFPVVVKDGRPVELSIRKLSDFIGGSNIKVNNIYYKVEDVDKEKIIKLFFDSPSVRAVNGFDI
ncbi:hypothetical protein J7438_05640 [Thalassotalea sp. G20_0]|uniref:hypothetical protein n=1 Tax=Thalassotalea sp. G20_0 TaxID=2821093 RepID=UPI001ADAC275|nr:hypothetical protein [Thalassotalea sp. G20_0]MBO9493568.1 hypothetical protein [Thalassotalea sp. G20_0]